MDSAKVLLIGGPKLGAELTEKSFRVPATDFRSRLENALRQRLAPNTTLQPKMLAHDLGVEDRSVRNWLAGDNSLNGSALANLLRYFAERGDVAFIGEVIGWDMDAHNKAHVEQKARAIFERALRGGQ